MKITKALSGLASGVFYLRRISQDLHRLVQLYELELSSRDLYLITPHLKDEVEISYDTLTPEQQGLDALLD